MHLILLHSVVLILVSLYQGCHMGVHPEPNGAQNKYLGAFVGMVWGANTSGQPGLGRNLTRNIKIEILNFNIN